MDNTFNRYSIPKINDTFIGVDAWGEGGGGELGGGGS